MEKYISIPRPTAGQPNFVIPVSNILLIRMISPNQLRIGFCNKATNVTFDISTPPTITTGTNTTFTTGKILIDSSATFITSGVKPGDYVVAGNTSKVVSVDSETQLTVANFIVIDKIAQNYSIYAEADLDAPAKFLQDAMLEALQSEWIDPIYEIDELPFTITSIST